MSNVLNWLSKTAFVVGVIFIWMILIMLVIPLLPFCLLMFLLKQIEEMYYKIFHGSIHFKIEETPWLHDDPLNRTIINGILVMETPITIEECREILDKKMINTMNENNKLRYPRASRYIHPGRLNYYWLKEENFSIEKHVYEWNSNVYQSEDEFKEVISKLGNRPLVTDENLSPWEYILIHFKDDQNVQRSAIYIRSHHSIADGVSLIYFLIDQLSDQEFKYDASKHHLSEGQKWLIRILAFFYIPYNVFRIVAPCSPTKTSFDCPKVSGKKRYHYTKPLSLALVKDVKTKLNVTVNDVMVGCLATCVRKYLEKRGESIPDNFITSIPLDTRLSIEEAKEFSNKVTISQFPLPTSCANPLKSILEINKRMNRVKESLEGFSIRAGLRLACYFTPDFVTKFIISASIRSVKMVMSNVPGPQEEISIADHTVKYLSFWPPCKDNIGAACSIFSYNGNIYVGISTDENISKNPEEILADLDDVLIDLTKQSQVTDRNGFINN